MNIDNIIEGILETVKSHKIEEGVYARWLWQNEAGNRELGINPYGCADAANILYTIGEFPSGAAEREKWITVLQDFQNPDTGLFEEETHHFIHTTAHCTAALELFDAKPRYPMSKLMEYSTKEGLYELLENLGWSTDPWNSSHQGAGIYAALVLSESVDKNWEDAYFDWFYKNADNKTGFWRKGAVLESGLPLFHNIAGTFHYLFNHEYAHMPLRYPEKMIDSCVDLYNRNEVRHNFGKTISFLEIDWIYCVSRASRQTLYRFNDCKKVLKDFAEKYIGYLNEIDVKTDDLYNDLHLLFGSVCALAELQQALPGMIRTSKPLKLVLDRRPFI